MHFQFTFVYIASIFVYVVYCLFILFALGGSLFLAMLKFSAFHHFGFFFARFCGSLKKEQQRLFDLFRLFRFWIIDFGGREANALLPLSFLIARCPSLCFSFAADLVLLFVLPLFLSPSPTFVSHIKSFHSSLFTWGYTKLPIRQGGHSTLCILYTLRQARPGHLPVVHWNFLLIRAYVPMRYLLFMLVPTT